ncbi:hypothetical protein HQ865_17290 [Mucilaginibacter mali]|uniref:Uncharacterized protein n=1 Tax=Mucilaginibacter mali TaxID=2740462 RepID=A0A7D4Q2M2_9SPHI|nr:hypothetical protein [Mucilaginibacter mali]QKJ31446.1 hypothetical protein HQ865_17290 [Mucilaginibacter mali]
MKITSEQETHLRKYLRDAMRYRETCEEVYDHVLTALQNRGYTGTFEEAVNQILREDFGGYDNLRQMEDDAKNAAVKSGISKYLGFYMGYFKWPRLIYVLVYAALIYLFFGYARLAIILEAMVALTVITPCVLSLMRYYQIGYRFGDTKRSVRDTVFAKIAIVPIRLFVLGTILLTMSFAQGHNIWTDPHPIVVTILFVLSNIYLRAFLELYRDEFKISLQA